MRRRTLLYGIVGTLPLGVAGCSGNGDGESDEAGDGSGDGGGSETTAAEETTAAAGTTTVDSPTTETTAGDGGDADEDGGTGTTPAETTPTETPSPTPTETPASATQVVEVGAGDGFRFAPESFEIAVGETVRWVWEVGGHNVTPDETPGGADWSGTPGGDSETYDAGHEYAHTFEAAGEYTYYCAPHRSVGMTGSFTVTE